MTVQIRTTHVGSLPRTDDLLEANAAHAEGRLDDAGLAAVVRAQTDAVVARQTDIGLSIVNDGEYGHAMTEKVDYGAWCSTPSSASAAWRSSTPSGPPPPGAPPPRAGSSSTP